MEKILPFITAMFVLSLVCERVGEFLKNYLSELKIRGFQITGDTVTKSPPDSEEERIRHYRILKINLLCGFVTAILCHASLFSILKHIDNPSVVFEWPDISDYTFDLKYFFPNIRFLLGCFLTGAFISVGSKFWHDLLDLLLKVKDAKRDYEFQFIKPLADLPTDEQRQILTAAITENIDTWRNTYKNFRGVSIGTKQVNKNGAMADTGELSLQFSVTEKQAFKTIDPNRVPTCIYYKGVRIPTDVVPSGKAKANHEKIDPKELPRPLGSSIGRANTEYSGTLGALMYQGDGPQRKYFGVSCYHVLYPEELKAGLKKDSKEVKTLPGDAVIGSRNINSPSARDFDEVVLVGSVHQGLFNQFLDVGFFETTEQKVSEAVFKFGVPDSVYYVGPSDEKTLHVKLCGRTSGIVETGVVELISSYPLITYFDRYDYQFLDLLKIRMNAKEGDSGAAILTKNNKLIGILVGVDDTFVYAVPAAFIENNYPYKFQIKI